MSPSQAVFTPTITGAQVKELREMLKQSLAEFGKTLKHAIDPRSKDSDAFTRQYISRIEHGQQAITQEIETAYWRMVGVIDDVPVGVNATVKVTVYAAPGQIPENTYIPRTAKVVKCARPGCPVAFIKTNPFQRYHDPDCQQAHQRDKKKRVT